MKILSPVGNFECLKVAVANGADEVYLGINDFNARNNIDGFTIETLKTAVDYAHLFGVKVLLAVNILFTNQEMQSVVDTVVDAYNMGVDAFIVQDLGLANLLCKCYPQIELHASTQMGLHNLEGVKEVLKYGFKRVVLARETPLSEIKRIKENTKVEIEYFAHGALCVAFSGNCYLSSYLHNASGNRGRCKQLCRLPYTLQYKGEKLKNGYLLSAKDFDMTKRLLDLKKAGVDVLKIEGRARRPYYVATATKQYRNVLNGVKVDYDQLKLGFNRNFTEGYFNGNGNIISEIQNHVGIKIGKVERVNKGKRFSEVVISSNRVLSPKSTFKLFSYGVEKSTLTAYDLNSLGDNKYKITTTQKVEKGDEVHLILDSLKETQTLAVSPKRLVKIKLSLIADKPINASVQIDDEKIEVNGEVCSLAIKQPLTREELISNFAKSENFSAELEIVDMDSVFLPKQKLNEFRRAVYEKICEKLLENGRQKLEKITLSLPKPINYFSDFAVVERCEFDQNAKNIIYSPSTYNLEDVSKFINFCKENDKKPYLDTPYFLLEKDYLIIEKIVKNTVVSIVANNYHALNFGVETIIGAGLNVYNGYTANVHNKPVITAENGDISRIDAPYMTLRHCPIKSHLNCNCNDCKYKDGYEYKMDSGKVLKLKRKRLSDCTFYLTD